MHDGRTQVGTNHLGHFLLTNLLLDSLAPGARVVITASEVHNPASPGGSVGPGATLGDLRGLADNGAVFEMIDGSTYNADKAYKVRVSASLGIRGQQAGNSCGRRTADAFLTAYVPGLGERGERRIASCATSCSRRSCSGAWRRVAAASR